MIRLGISGAGGFIGQHLINYLGLYPDEYKVIPVHTKDFADPTSLSGIIESCDVFVHLAAINRHPVDDVIEKGNREICEKLIRALESSVKAPDLIFASTTQEGNGSPYALAKEYTRETLAHWASKAGVRFRGLIIPNVFGPFGVPFYHSVVATFCYQISRDEIPQIKEDNTLRLLYVTELCEYIRKILHQTGSNNKEVLSESGSIRVRELMERITNFDSVYRQNRQIPELSKPFEVNLFNTYRSFIPQESLPVRLTLHSDSRGSLAEVIRSGTQGQVFFSLTKPGITRGNHFHLRKIERFCVLQGEALIRLRQIGKSESIEISVNGNEPTVVDMPVWYTHSITNTGDTDLLTLFWSNELYNPEDADTWYEEV